MMRIFPVLIAVVAAALFAGCAPKFPACVREHAQQQIIRWGEIHGGSITAGYQINARAELFGVRQVADSVQPEPEPKGLVESWLYCDRLDMVRHAFLDVQALNMPGETRHFVEFSNPQNGLQLRAIWNPEFKNAGNERFRAVYDSLETMRLSAK